jgi:hypothetical protein
MKAFPTTKPLDSWGDPNQGMDLRDYFAAKAMQSLLLDSNYDAPISDLVKLSYQIADAMMEARKNDS